METKPTGELRSNQQSLEDPSAATARVRNTNSNRSNYDNVASIQPQQQHRTVSNLAKTSGGQRLPPGQRYEEANV